MIFLILIIINLDNNKQNDLIDKDKIIDNKKEDSYPNNNLLNKKKMNIK